MENFEFKGTKEQASVYFIPNRLIRTPFGSKQEITPKRERKAFIKGVEWHYKNSKAPEYYQELLETVIDLKILKNQIIDANKTNHLFNGIPDLIQKWIDRKEQLLKEATEL